MNVRILSRGRLPASLLCAAVMIHGSAGCGGTPAGSPPTYTETSAAAARRPFPQHVTYAAGTIKPNNVTQQQLDDAVRSYYDAWKARFLTPLGSDQYYVHAQTWQPDAVSVSEGHGYGMNVVALMAGYDPNAQQIYDGLYRFFRAHPAYDPQLMGWYQRAGGGGTVVDGEAYNATDGDLDIAYSLLLADQQWGSTGPINYLQEARNVIGAIMQDDINRNYWSVMRGATGQGDDSSRPSDYMLDHFRAYQAFTGDGNWSRVIDKVVSILTTLQANNSPGTGLIPDFTVGVGGTPVPAPPNAFESQYDGNYYWNSCRVPWRLAEDYVNSGDGRVAAILGKINTFLQNATGGDPSGIAAGYLLSGGAIDQFSSLAFIAPAAVGAMVGPQNQAWLNSLWQKVIGTSIDQDDYFGNSIKMLSVIILSGNWWVPQTPVQNKGPVVSITSPASGASFVAPASITLAANPSASGGAVARVDFLSGTTVLGSATQAPYRFTWSGVPAGSYTLTARVTDSRGQTAQSAPVTVTVSNSTLPAPWQGQDIGAVGVAGGQSFANGTFTLTGSGRDIWGTSDEFHYLHQPLSGDGQITARVTGQKATAPWAQAGVMIREGLSGGSRHALMMVSAQAGVDLEHRDATGGPTGEVYNGGNAAAPVWVRLVRKGQSFSGYSSADGVNWSLQGTVTIPMGGSAFAGLAVSSLNNGVLNTATFTSVSVAH